MKDILTADALRFFEEYINTSSPSGYEYTGQKVWSDYLRPHVDALQMDAYGNTWGIVNPDAEYRVAIEAHADEITWAVRYIDDDGNLYITHNGGTDESTAATKRVEVHTRDGKKYPGVIAWPAIHMYSRDKEMIKPEAGHLYVDVGAKDKKEVEKMGIHVGCLITYPHTFTTIGDYFVGRAMDNRAGGFMIAQVARLLKKNKKKLPFALYVVNSVQEEVGVRGAKMSAEQIQPHVALVTDVDHDTTMPCINKKKHGDQRCGNGPVVTTGPTMHQKLVDTVVGTAKTQKIPFQWDVRSRGGWNISGTDTDEFAYNSNGGVACLISLPLKYMHTTAEMVHKNDVENTIRLMYETLLTLDPKDNYKYLEL